MGGGDFILVWVKVTGEAKMITADALSVISALWPIFLFGATMIFALVKIYVDLEHLKQKVTVLFELFNESKK